jgi:hypothetical protein
MEVGSLVKVLSGIYEGLEGRVFKKLTFRKGKVMFGVQSAPTKTVKIDNKDVPSSSVQYFLLEELKQI